VRTFCGLTLLRRRPADTARGSWAWRSAARPRVPSSGCRTPGTRRRAEADAGRTRPALMPWLRREAM
jgi:hypothetical protein